MIYKEYQDVYEAIPLQMRPDECPYCHAPAYYMKPYNVRVKSPRKSYVAKIYLKYCSSCGEPCANVEDRSNFSKCNDQARYEICKAPARPSMSRIEIDAPVVEAKTEVPPRVYVEKEKKKKRKRKKTKSEQNTNNGSSHYREYLCATLIDLEFFTKKNLILRGLLEPLTYLKETLSAVAKSVNPDDELPFDELVVKFVEPLNDFYARYPTFCYPLPQLQVYASDKNFLSRVYHNALEFIYIEGHTFKNEPLFTSGFPPIGRFAYFLTLATMDCSLFRLPQNKRDHEYQPIIEEYQKYLSDQINPIQLQKPDDGQENQPEDDKIKLIDTLYVFTALDNLDCNLNHHDLIAIRYPARTVTGEIVRLPVHHCRTCNRIFIGSKTLHLYQEEFGKIMVKRHRTLSAGSAEYENFEEFADESELHQHGYNVRRGVLTEEERHAILKYLYDSGEMSYFAICRDIEKAINLSGNSVARSAAVAKWENDLKFIGDYVKENGSEELE